MNCTDQEIIKQVNNGETDRFAVLVKRYQQQAYRLALSILRQTMDAEDAVSEAFVKAFTALPKCRADTDFKSWFLKITYNCCQDTLRKRKNLLNIEPLVNSLETITLTENPAEKFENQEMKETIWQAMAELTAEERAAVILKYYHDVSYQKISVILQWPLGSVASRLSRARDKLRIRLKGGTG
ncbi:MAG: hypothetical protein CVU87_12325 [Firmicutes bacterium HGW-Firmicutes-12]|jgi:RNA polymerase sigma-70 factor (ECF subfamily)|nr:MAG: hypothetical protein CVU87_12325 [Firmicutes bacterium HGW-Firmicutes-12]